MSESEESGEKEPKRDWKRIRYEYESSNIGLRPLAKAHGLSFSTVSKRSMREGWSQRGKLVAKTARKLETEVTQAIRDEIRDELAPWIEEKKREVTKRSVRLYEKGVERIERIYDSTEATDTKMESEAARAFETLTRVGRTALGMSDGSGVGGALNVNILANQVAVGVSAQ